MKKILIKNEQEMKAFAFEFAKTLKPGSVICLYGDLGAGKTFFVQQVMKALGYEGHVTSPTFVLQHLYPVNHGKIKEVCHVDAYRLENGEELKNIAIEEWFSRKDAVVFIEWADHVKDILPRKRVDIQIQEGEDTHGRILHIESF